jgi:hypothetical protein
MDFAQRVEELLAEAGAFLADLVAAPRGDAANQLIDEQLHSFFQAYHRLKQRTASDELSVAVLALAKSGARRLGAGGRLVPARRAARGRAVPPAGAPPPARSARGAAPRLASGLLSAARRQQREPRRRGRRHSRSRDDPRGGDTLVDGARGGEEGAPARVHAYGS